MEQIINETALREDSLEGIAELLDCHTSDIELSDWELEDIIDAMFEAQSDVLQRIAQERQSET